MNRKKVSSIVAFIVGTLIFVVGIAHTLAVSNLKESLSEHSTLTQSRQNQVLINWVFSGVAMSGLGAIIVLLGAQLKKGKKMARNLTAMIAVFFLFFTLAAYMIEPNPRLLLVFGFPALLLLMPMVIFWKEFVLD